MPNWLPHLISDPVLRAYGDALDAKKLPVIFSLKHLSLHADVSYQFLHSVVGRVVDPYVYHSIPKKSGGKRSISVPNDPLMTTQRWINKKILGRLEIHHCAMAYEKNSSILKNAMAHVGCTWMIKIDISNFFDSICEKRVYRLFQSLGYTDLLSLELSRIVTRVPSNSVAIENKDRYKFYEITKLGVLPQGAPTSPKISNLIFKTVDDRLQALAQEHGLRYTRYADDMIFSSAKFSRPQAVALLVLVRKIIQDAGFDLNKKKTKIVPPGAMKIATGLLVNKSKVSITKSYKEKIDLLLYHLDKRGPKDHCDFMKKKNGKRASVDGLKNHLLGMIHFTYSVEPEWAKSRYQKFSEISWPKLNLNLE